MSIMFHRTWSLLNLVRCFAFLRIAKQWLKMIIKGRSPTMRLIQNPQSCPWQNQSRYKDINQICRHQTPTRRHIDKGQLHAWWVEQSCPFVQQRRFQLNLLFSEFQLYQLPWNDGEKDSRRERRREDCGNVKADVKIGLACCDKFFDCAKSNCIEKSGDTQGTLSSWLEAYRKTCSERTQSSRRVVFSSVAKRCRDGQKYEETRSVWNLRHRR